MLHPTYYTLIEGKRYDLGAIDAAPALSEASRLWSAHREETGGGVSEIGNGCRVYREELEDSESPFYVGAVSYNGRIWTPEAAPLNTF